MTSAAGPTSDRNAKLRAIADAYFSGLRNGDVSPVPYDENVLFRTPLAPGGSEVALRGRAALLDFFAGIYAALEEVNVIDYYFNAASTSIAGGTPPAEIALRPALSVYCSGRATSA